MFARLSAGDFDLAVLQLPEMSEPNVLRYFLHSAAVPPRERTEAACATSTSTPSSTRGTARRARRRATRDLHARSRGARARERCNWLPLWYEDRVTAVTSARAFGRSRRARRVAGSLSRESPEFPGRTSSLPRSGSKSPPRT